MQVDFYSGAFSQKYFMVLITLGQSWTSSKTISVFLPDAFFNPLYEKLKMYYVTGGMPESVRMWTEVLFIFIKVKISSVLIKLPAKLF